MTQGALATRQETNNSRASASSCVWCFLINGGPHHTADTDTVTVPLRRPHQLSSVASMYSLMALCSSQKQNLGDQQQNEMSWPPPKSLGGNRSWKTKSEWGMSYSFEQFSIREIHALVNSLKLNSQKRDYHALPPEQTNMMWLILFV